MTVTLPQLRQLLSAGALLAAVTCFGAITGCGKQHASQSSQAAKVHGVWTRATEFESQIPFGIDPDKATLEGRHVITPDETDDVGVGINFRKRYTAFRIHFGDDRRVELKLNGHDYNGTFSLTNDVLNLTLKDSAGDEYTEEWGYSFQTVGNEELLVLNVFYNKPESIRRNKDGSYEFSADAASGPKKLTLMSASLPFRKTQ
jgi:hypothetical protein